jgi:histidinol-phosphate aminotransferase
MSATDAFIAALRPDVRDLPAYNAGASAERVREQFGVSRVVKLASNENPCGASPLVREALQRAVEESVARYPDSSSSALRNAIGATLDVEPARILFGNGSEDLLAVAAQTFLSPGDEVVTVTPSFGLHLIYPQLAGARVRAVPMRKLRFDVDALCEALTPRTRMLLVSNPSNPVGAALSGDEFARLLSAVAPGTLVVWDEAYFEYARVDPSYAASLPALEHSHSPWLVLRTFSKAYGLAGLRIGYAVASDARLADLMNRVRTPFNINRLAQCAALAAWSDTAYVADVVQHTIRERERMRDALTAMGYACAPSLANFLFFDAREDADALAQRLMRAGVIVKPWREPDFTRCVRVSTGSRDDNDFFIETLGRVRSARH